MLKLQQFRDKAHGLPDLLNFALMPEDGIVQGKDGCLMASWYYRGEDLASCTHAELATISARLNASLCALGSGWMSHTDSIRRFIEGYPKGGHFPDPTTRVIDEERRALFEAEGIHLEGLYAFTLTFLPDSKTAQKVKDFLYEGGEVGQRNAHTIADRVVAGFKQQIDEFEGVLSGLFPMRRMKGIRGEDGFGREYVEDEQLQYLEYCVSGEQRPVRLPSIPMYLDAIIGGHKFRGGNEPLINKKLIQIVAINGFPQDSYPGILGALDELHCEYRWSTRFIYMDSYAAKQILEKSRKRWQQKQRGLKDQVTNSAKGATDLDAVHMTLDVEVAMGEAESGMVKFGYYTSVIVLMGEDHNKVREDARNVAKAIRNLGFGAQIEDINAVEAYLGSIPGHGFPNVRRPILHTMNLADMLPITAIWAGLEHHPSPYYPKKSPPLIYASTTGSTPFRMSLHVDDVGHALMLGPTGSGKTTALNLLIAQHFKYPSARVFGLDYKNGSYALCEASGGHYYDILAPGAELSFCPLSAIDDRIESRSELAWAAEWLDNCLELQGVITNPAKRNMLLEALKRFATKNKHTRSMTDFVSEVQHEEMREALMQYTLAGPLGSLLDAEHDSLADSRFMMFEMERLLEMGNKVSVPVLMYLMHQMDKRLDGKSPTFVPCDESWKAAEHRLGLEWFKRGFKTWRSKNANLLLATQEPNDLFNSPLRQVVLASCPTRILLANPEAIDSQRDSYKLMAMNDREIEIIATMTKKREYFYKSPLGRRRFSFGMGPVTLSFVGASGKEEVTAAKLFKERYGDRWPAEWLRQRSNLPDWGDYWDQVHQKGTR